jgi:hypothetical protein
MMGILYYKTLLGTTPAEAARFDTKFEDNVTVGPLAGQFGANEKSMSPHPLISNANPAERPYLKSVVISDMDDLVPGDTVIFANYPDYAKVDPGGLWNGEWGVYTRRIGNQQFFEGFGVPEDTYDNIVQRMQTAYDNNWTPQSNAPRRPSRKSDLTIDKRLPGIKDVIYRIDLAAYNT